jgi:sec-independent protein translocase protein TatA
MPELIIILVIALLVIGPQKLPDLAKSLGKGLAEFKKATNDFQRTMQEEAHKEKEAEQAAPQQVAQTEQASVDVPAPEQPQHVEQPKQDDSQPPAA